MLINLLPTTEREFLRWENIYQSVIFFSQIVFGALLMLIILFLTILFFLKIQLNAIKDANRLEEQSPVAIATRELKEEISSTNKKMAAIDAIQSQQKFSPVILEDLIKLTPAGIQLFNFFYDGKSQKATLDGHALTREDFISFKSALENYPKFSEIDSPLSNLIKSTENNFRISFLLRTK